MNEDLLRHYAMMIANTVMTMSRGFGPRLDQWCFMRVTEPKIPFANESKVPNITFTFNLETDNNAQEVLELIYEFLYDQGYKSLDSEFGHYLICYAQN
ncbi:MAG: hypothetical protein WC044_11890 [Crocinitomicaceae bacterium]